MKIINILIALIFVSALSVLNAQNTPTAIFQFNSTYCGTRSDDPCLMTDATNWLEGGFPAYGDKVTIDLTSSNYKGNVFIMGENLNLILTSVSIHGGVNNVGSIPMVSFYQSTIIISGLFNVSNSSVSFDNSLATNNPTIKFDSAWQIYNSNITGTTVALTSEGVFIDQYSSFKFQIGSNVQIDGIATFWVQPSITDQSTFTVSDTKDGFSYFNKGINSDNLVTLALCTLFGTSNFVQLSVLDEVALGEKTSVTISGKLKFTGQGTFSNIPTGSKLVIAGQTVETIQNINLSGGSLVINNPVANVSTVTGNGTVLIDIVKLGNEPVNYLTGINGINGITITVAGSANVFIVSGSFLALDDAASQYSPDAKAVAMVTFEGTNSIGYINTNRTSITLVDGSITSLEGPTATFIQNQDLNLFGSLSLNGSNFYGSVTTMDNLAYIGMNDDFITGTVDLIAGRLHPSGVCTIGGDLIASNGAFIDFDETSGTLGVNGNFEMDSSSNIYVSQAMISKTSPLLTVDGSLVLNGTLILDFTLDSISDGDVYIIIEYESAVVGEFTTITAFQNGALLTTFSYKLQNSDNQISVVLADLSISPHHKLAGWAVFLIILSIFIVLGAGFYGFIRYKKRSGYLRI